MTLIDPFEEQSLYEVLQVDAPAADGDGDDRPGGETALTATKETMDNDTEDSSDDDILNL